MATEVGSAYVSIIPSFRGFASAVQAQVSRELARAMGPPAEREGDAAGREAGKSFNNSLGDALGGMGGVIAGAIASVGIASLVATALEQGRDEARITAALGLDPAAARTAADAAGSAYAAGWGDSLGQVGDATVQVSQQLSSLGVTGAAEIEDVTTTALTLADVMGEDVNSVIRATGQIMRNGLAPDAQAAMDVLSAGMQTGANRSEDLLDTFTEYSPNFRQLGLDAQTSLGLLSQGLEAGARNSDQVADALKEFSIRAIGGEADEGFRAIGLSATEMGDAVAAGGDGARDALGQVLDGLRNVEDPTERATAAFELFGTMGEDMADSLFALDPAAASAAGGLDNIDGAAAQARDTIADTDAQALAGFMRSLQQLGVEVIGGQVVPFLRDLATWVQNNSTTLQNIGIVVATVVTPALIALGLQSLIAGARMAAGWALALGPVGLAISIILGLVAFIVLNWDNIVAATRAAWGWVRDHIIDPVRNAVSAAIDWLRRLWDGIRERWDSIVSTVREAAGRVYDATVGRIRDAVSDAVSRLAGFVGSVRTRFGEVVSAVRDAIGRAVDWVRGLPGRALDALGNIGSSLYNAGRDLINGFVRGIQSIGGAIRDAIMGFIRSAWEGVKNFFGISSPSRLMMYAGEMVGEGLVLGLDSMDAAVSRAADRMANAARPGLIVPATRISPAAALTPATYGADPTRGGGRSPTINVYPRERQSEESIAAAMERRLAPAWR